MQNKCEFFYKFNGDVQYTLTFPLNRKFVSCPVQPCNEDQKKTVAISLLVVLSVCFYKKFLLKQD